MAKCEFHDRERSRCAICSPESAYSNCQRQGKLRNLSFSLTLQEFEALVNAECYWCGRYGANGVDRRDNRIGYVKNENVNNVVPCCWPCNRLKGALGEYEFVELIFKIARHQEKLKKVKLEKHPLPANPIAA